MQTQVIKVQHPYLSRFIESFIFFSKWDTAPINYTTFPNTNLCLALYADNEITYAKGTFSNVCEINTSRSLYQSRLYGFHEKPFIARLNCTVDQICILFRPAALRAFTNIPYIELVGSENVFEAIFTTTDSWVLEKLFNEFAIHKRVQILEHFLLKKLSFDTLQPRLNAILRMMHERPDNFRIEHAAMGLGINTSTVYRIFYAAVGQNPKTYFKTVRFRKALQHILHVKNAALTDIAYCNDYYDQAHFNKEIRDLSGFRPGELRTIAQYAHEQLVWVLRD